MKTCSKCKENKSLELFYKSKAHKDGYRGQCKLCLKKYDQENRDRISKYQSQYKKENKDILVQKNRQYRENNKDKINKWREDNDAYLKQYRINNRKKYRERFIERCQEDFMFKFKSRVRGLIGKSFKRGKNKTYKNLHSEEILGCSIDEFKEYIASKFKKNMSFDNYGEWHLDHIIPLRTATTEEEIIRLNHYTNFQPLFAKENLSKGGKIIEVQLVLL